MSQKNNQDYLRDLLKELDDVASFTQDGQSAFDNDLKTQKAVIRSYEVIGEIVKRLDLSLKDRYPEVNWRQLITFRDFLAHNYDKVVTRLLWEAAADLPNLRATIEKMLADLDLNDE